MSVRELTQGFTESAKHIVDLAEREARAGGSIVASHHLLLGALIQTHGLGAQLLEQLGVTEQLVRETLGERGAPSRSVQWSMMAERVLEIAAEEAERLGAAGVATQHLVLALCRAPGWGSSALHMAGVSYQAVREAVIEHFAHGAGSCPADLSGWSEAEQAYYRGA
jgi:ATP-dependent Clp protease ATP-binding subunit ClpC